MCECECDKSCDIGEYLDYSNCKCRKKLVDKLVEECSDNIEKTKLHSAEKENKHKYSSCIVYIVLFSLRFAINIRIYTYFVYSYWYLKNYGSSVTLNSPTEATIY